MRMAASSKSPRWWGFVQYASVLFLDGNIYTSDYQELRCFAVTGYNPQIISKRVQHISRIIILTTFVLQF